MSVFNPPSTYFSRSFRVLFERQKYCMFSRQTECNKHVTAIKIGLVRAFLKGIVLMEHIRAVESMKVCIKQKTLTVFPCEQ
jgi:hypothetical protein